MIHFQKIYSDLVTADGTVVIAYQAALRVLGIRTPLCGVEIYTPDGERRIYRGTNFTLKYQPRHGPWSPESRPHPSIDWSVKMARGEVQVNLQTPAGDRTFTGVGYSDWVCLDRAPKNLQLHTLAWGRVHEAGQTSVFTHATFKDGREWKKARRWSSAGAIDLEEIDTSAWITERVLHQDTATDKTRFPGWIERTLSRAITGETHETRWLCRTDSGWAVHEQVQFC